MASYKCKMCGGTLEIGPNETVITCEYCGTAQTLPKLDDERRSALYERAAHFRRNNEFDKAANIYEQILDEDNTDAEAYWSLVLCRYGIEYVDDPSSHEKKPTINRIQYTSVFDDDNYKSALEYADTLQRSLYEKEAQEINEIQKNLLSISEKEEPFDVFICYKETDDIGRRTPDSVLANDLYHQLTQEGFKVFYAAITLEDKLGSAYEPYIFAALNSAKVMVVLGTRPEYFSAVWVRNEWSRYLALIKQGEKKVLIPAYKDMDPYDLPQEFSHLQAQDMSKLGFMQDLIRGIKKLSQPVAPTPTIVKEHTPVPETHKKSPYGKIFVAVLLTLTVTVCGFLAFAFITRNDDEVPPLSPTLAPSASTTVNTTVEAIVQTTTVPPVEPTNKQIVRVVADGTMAKVSLDIWQNGTWDTVFTTIGTLGRDGISPNISESSQKTPAGTFDLGFAFGINAVNTGLDYRTVNQNTYWVDDPSSAYYNMWQDGTDNKDWSSAEALYSQFSKGKMRYCIVIEFNGSGLSNEGVRPGGGSVIFLCGRAGELTSTYGDIYISETKMLELLSYLDKSQNPIITIS